MEKTRENMAADFAGPLATRGAYTGPNGSTERIFAEVLASVVRADHVSVDSHFFDDLGANSLVMAQFCARVRKRGDLPSVSMKDIYRNPTIRSLTAALASAAPAPVESVTPEPTEQLTSAPKPGSTRRYVLCGILQFLIFVGYSYLTGVVMDRGYNWISSSPTWIDIFLRSVIMLDAIFVGLCCFPIVAKWVLIGRWKACEFPVWSLAYVRFWTVKTLVHANPMMLFVGTPLYVLYLRALGARIGKNVTIFSPSIPVCTDLLTIGSGTVIRKGSTILGYRAHAGRIQIGPVTIGRDVYIGEATVLDINTSMGDGSQLGHSSALQSGEAVPDGEHWHGSPAQSTQVNYIRVAPARCSTLRKTAFTLYILFMTLCVYPPLGVAGFYILYRLIPILDKPTTSAITSPELYTDALTVSLILFFGAIIIGFAVIFTVPRLLNLLIKPDKVYPLYGFHYMAHLSIAGMTNSKFFHQLFGDSSYIVHYLRCLGYKLPNVVQTGANFGTVMQHDTPYLSTIGSGTMVCDGLSMLHADYSGTSFRVSRVSIGADNFLGNGIAFPAGGRTGNNCLIGTKAMVPLDGEIREGIGLLGSPCFEIPRSVERDKQFDHLMTGDKQRKLLAAKNRYNLRTMGLFLFIQWLHSFILTVFVLATINLYIGFGLVTFIVALMLSLFFSTGYSILMERAVCRFRALKPQFCSIYDPYYWWHERLWKVTSGAAGAFSGTPFKNVMGRLLGVRIGRRVFDDGCNFTERTLVSIGDDCTINSSCEIQCHSLEDGIFKSDRTTIGAGCTLGVGVLIHYGVKMGDGSELAADSFLMKGEEIPPHARWGGNPARAITGRPASSITLSVTHHSPLAGEEAQPDHLNGNAYQTEHNVADVQVYQDSNGACRLVQQQQGAARRALKGGKIQWEN